jgi:hypothetical protein
VPLTTGKSGSKEKRAKSARASHAAHKARVPQIRAGVLEEWPFCTDGHRGRVLTLDANSATFTSDLTLMFEKNVARARREHKRKADSAGRAG